MDTNINPKHPYIWMHILIHILYISYGTDKKICQIIKSSSFWRSFSLFSWP